MHAVPPVAPYNVTAKRVSSTEIFVSWDPLSLVEARGFVISYTVAYTTVS